MSLCHQGSQFPLKDFNSLTKHRQKSQEVFISFAVTTGQPPSWSLSSSSPSHYTLTFNCDLVASVPRRVSRLTEGGLRGRRPLHTGAVIGHVFIWAGAHGSAGAEQTQPLAFLPVTRVGHWHRKRNNKKNTHNGIYETRNIQGLGACSCVRADASLDSLSGCL